MKKGAKKEKNERKFKDIFFKNNDRPEITFLVCL